MRSTTLLPLALLLTASMAGCVHEQPTWWVEASAPERNIRHLLTPLDSPVILVEIDVEGTGAPTDLAIAGLKEELNRITGKSVEIVSIENHPVRANPTFASSWELQEEWQDDDLDKLDVSLHNVVHVIYLEGDAPATDDGRQVYGHASNVGQQGVIWMYLESLRQARIGPVTTDAGDDVQPEVDRAVLVHEFGHVIGLVDNGLEMQNERDDGTHHSTNRDSVMFAWVHGLYPYEAPQTPTDWFVPVWHFDDDDVADVRAYQELHGMP